MDDQYDGMEAYINQASSLNGQLLLLIAIAIILGLGKGGVPGFATVAPALTVATAPMNISGGLGYAVAIQVPILAMIDISAAYLHRKSIDWNTTLSLLPVTFVGMAFGQLLDKFMTDALARLFVGFLLLSILILKVWKDVLAFFLTYIVKSPPPDQDQEESMRILYHDICDIENHKAKQSPPTTPSASTSTSNESHHQNNKAKTYMWAGAVGIFGGAATMLTNSMGPIMNVYLLSVRKMSPTEYVATRAMFFCFLNIGKIPIRFASGSLGWSMLPLAFGLGIVSVIGVFCAKPIMLSMTEATFVKLELVVVAFAGVRLMWLGLTML